MERSAPCMRRPRAPAEEPAGPVRLLVTGAAGMLGLDVLRAGERAGYELVGLPRGELDITDAEAEELGGRTVARRGRKPKAAA